MTTYSNFNGLYTSVPHYYLEPQNLPDLIDCVSISTTPTRIIGSVHTFNDLSMTNRSGTIIDTGYLNNVLSIDYNTYRVTVEAGTKLDKLLYILEKYGLTLPVVIATNQVSIGGAISTGAHGSNYLHGSMSSLVKEVNVVTADGTYHLVDSGTELAALSCSLGSIGAIYSVVLQAVELFSIEESNITVPWHQISNNLDQMLNEYQFTEINVYQFSDNLDCDVSLKRKVPYNPHLGPGYKQLTTHNTSWYIEIELAFPFEIANTAVQAVASFHRDYRLKYGIYSRSELFVRFSDADPTLISMASGRKTIYISTFFGHEYEPNVVYEFMARLSDKMISYKARPHYGKQNNLSPEQMSYLYGNNYYEFNIIRIKADPYGKFSNNYIKRLFYQ